MQYHPLSAQASSEVISHMYRNPFALISRECRQQNVPTEKWMSISDFTPSCPHKVALYKQTFEHNAPRWLAVKMKCLYNFVNQLT